MRELTMYQRAATSSRPALDVHRELLQPRTLVQSKPWNQSVQCTRFSLWVGANQEDEK